MKPNDLRVGNLVKQDTYRNGKCDVVRKVASVNKEGFLNVEVLGGDTMKSHPINWFSGIPLSEEILLKVGFSIATDKYRGYLSPSFRNGQRIRIKTTNSGNFIYQLNHEGYPLYLESLHQLQNLFYSLSGGQELNTLGL